MSCVGQLGMPPGRLLAPGPPLAVSGSHANCPFFEIGSVYLIVLGPFVPSPSTGDRFPRSSRDGRRTGEEPPGRASPGHGRRSAGVFATPLRDTRERKTIPSLPFGFWLPLSWAQPLFQEMSNQRLDATVLGSEAPGVHQASSLLPEQLFRAQQGVGVSEEQRAQDSEERRSFGVGGPRAAGPPYACVLLAQLSPSRLRG